MNHLGQRITAARAERGLSLSELARRARVSKGHLHKIETDDSRKPSLELVIAIAEALGMGLEELIGYQKRLVTCPTCKGKGQILMNTNEDN